jgi:hypothetical protein
MSNQLAFALAARAYEEAAIAKGPHNTPNLLHVCPQKKTGFTKRRARGNASSLWQSKREMTGKGM